MRMYMKVSLAAAFALGWTGLHAAKAADMLYPQGQYEAPPPQAYGPPPDESYGYAPPPVAYGYPPPARYYEYPPPYVVVPDPITRADHTGEVTRRISPMATATGGMDIAVGK